MSSEPLLPWELQGTALAVLVTFLAWVVRLIRQQRISLRDSLLWVISTSMALGFTLFPRALRSLSEVLNIKVPANALFAAGFVYVMLNLLSLTIAVSSNAARARRLTQECALLRAEIESLRSAHLTPEDGALHE